MSHVDVEAWKRLMCDLARQSRETARYVRDNSGVPARSLIRIRRMSDVGRPVGFVAWLRRMLFID